VRSFFKSEEEGNTDWYAKDIFKSYTQTQHKHTLGKISDLPKKLDPQRPTDENFPCAKYEFLLREFFGYLGFIGNFLNMKVGIF
jgi:hypothetical protein